MGQPRTAFVHLEASLARGLLDDLADPSTKAAGEAVSLQSRLRTLDQNLSLYLSVPKLKPDYEAVRDELLRQRRETTSRLAAIAAEDSARHVLPLSRIQRQLPPAGALVVWVEVPQMKQHYACIVRAEGDPLWVPLPGTGGPDDGRTRISASRAASIGACNSRRRTPSNPSFARRFTT